LIRIDAFNASYRLFPTNLKLTLGGVRLIADYLPIPRPVDLLAGISFVRFSTLTILLIRNGRIRNLKNLLSSWFPTDFTPPINGSRVNSGRASL